MLPKYFKNTGLSSLKVQEEPWKMFVFLKGHSVVL